MLALRSAGPSLWTWLAVGIATVLAVPIAAVVSSLAIPAGDVWLHLWRTQLLELVGQTLLLLAGVGTGTLMVGGGLAWLVVHHRFPGRGVLEWALILPLAVPAYVIGFAFIGLMFAAFYSATNDLQGGFFAGGQQGNLSTFQYFSFTTLTTLGYGDFTPVADGARAVAMIEAMSGQIFLATLVARLVSAFRPSGRTPSPDSAGSADSADAD